MPCTPKFMPNLNEQIITYSQQAEDQLFDRKSVKTDPKDIAHEVCSFANVDGGVTAVGIENNGDVTGFRNYPKAENRIRKVLSGWVTPTLPVTVTKITFEHEDGYEDFILEIKVEPSQFCHVTGDDKVHTREGDDTRVLKFQERQDLERAKGLQSFETTLVPAGMEKISVAKVLEYAEKTNIQSDDASDILVMKDFALSKDDGSIQLNVAGLLLFSDNPESVLDRAVVRIMWIDGREQKSGVDLNIIKDETVRGTLASQIDEVEILVGAKLREFTRLGKDGKFESIPEYPPFAVLEAIVNAVTHRDYGTSTGADIQIKIFEDRIEFISPGNFPRDIRVENILEKHFSRNPKIAAALRDMGYVKEYGEGVDRIFQEMAKLELPPPDYISGNGQVILTFVNDVDGRELSAQRESQNKLESIISKRELTLNEQKVVVYVLENEKVSPAEVAEIIGMSIGTARSVLRDLSSFDPAVLVRVGKSKTDPKAFFVINTLFLEGEEDIVLEVEREPESDTPSLFGGLK